MPKYHVLSGRNRSDKTAKITKAAKTSRQPRRYRRGQPLALMLTTLIAMLAATIPVSVPALAKWQLNQKLNSPVYKQQYGHWEVVNLPEEFRLNTIHGAVLPTGKVLLVAGSGNNRDNFNAYSNDGKLSVLKTAVFDPKTNIVKLVDTPHDLFCSGHAFTQQGNLLVAGGTSGYELLEGEVKKPAGALVVHNENPDDKQRTFEKGTRFTSPAGKVYVSTEEVTVQPAIKHDFGQGKVRIEHSSARVFVEAIEADKSYITTRNEQYTIEGLQGKYRDNIYGQGGPITLDKQDYRGDEKAYEFDPYKEAYVQVGSMKESRWYPSLPMLTSGQILAVSGLDNAGIITETTEYYDPSTRRWTEGPNRAFPTYPALFRTMDPDVLFFSGSNAGYGPEDKGRQPGFWNVKTNQFTPVNGLRDPHIVETSGSVWLPPEKGSNDGNQSQRIMIAGGGGIGESTLSTARTDIIDLAKPGPQYVPGPDLPDALRYLNLTVTPWDEIFASGGSRDYRAKSNSYSHKAFSIDPASYQLTPLADELVGRSYHSGSLLLPDGRILVFGNDPLFSDKNNTISGKFEQRLEIFTPPQFFRGERPVLQGVNEQEARRGQQLSFAIAGGPAIQSARLIPPSSSTHVTNIEQRSVGAIVKQSGDTITVDVPADENLLPNGYYMLFVVTPDGIPSEAKMIKIVR